MKYFPSHAAFAEAFDGLTALEQVCLEVEAKRLGVSIRSLMEENDLVDGIDSPLPKEEARELHRPGFGGDVSSHCYHDRLTEDGVCRNCGTDRRGI